MDFFSENVEAGIQHMSESVFVGLCQIVGTSINVAIRRETTNIMDTVDRLVIGDGFIRLFNGSRKEGFRLEGSDVDIMIWPNDHRVIRDMSESEYYYTDPKTLILSDGFESPPGYALLELLTPTTYRNIQLACVRMNDKLYISSSLFRGHATSCSPFNGATEHGPCVRSRGERGGKEYDSAYSFACDVWPPSASSWIHKCHSWPDKEVVNSIVKNKCHFVPVGNPSGIHQHEEWRISFSVAEHKLMDTMNHCQFLTYGLLKIFLKEVIDKQSAETITFLNSYHIKTAVLWVIQNDTIRLWCPQNLLAGFWVCFKLILKWVYEGVCPNFFIPQNNLFLSKVHGPAQRNLFVQFYGLYEKGLACLLQSTSIRSYITNVLYNPRLSVCTNDDGIKSEIDYDIELFSEIFWNSSISTVKYKLHYSIKFLHIMEQMIGSPLTHFQVPMLQSLTATALQTTAFILHNMFVDKGLNKQTYIAEKISCYMLKLAAKFGCISDMVYIAMYYYKTFKPWKALSVIEIIKVKLAQPGLMYGREVNPRRYIEAVGTVLVYKDETGCSS